MAACFNRPNVPPALSTKAVAVFCKQFVSRDFNPEKKLSSSLVQTRAFVLTSFLALANVPDEGPSLPIKEVRPILRRSWPTMWRWIRYFFFEFQSGVWTQSSSEAVKLISGILSVIASDRTIFRSAIKDDGLLEFLVKLWAMSSGPSFDEHTHIRALELFLNGFQVATSGLGQEWRSAASVRSTILKEAGGDADGLAVRIIAYLKPPATEDNFILVDKALQITLLLMCDAQQRSPTELAETFVKYDMVSHISRYLLLASSTARTDSQEGEISTRIIECSIPILASSLSSGNAPHAATAMLKHKFLRSVVNLLSLSPQVLDGKHKGLEYMFTMNIPSIPYPPLRCSSSHKSGERNPRGRASGKNSGCKLFERCMGELFADGPRADHFQCNLRA